MEKTLVLVFRKSTGASYSFSLPYPDAGLEGSDVKALGEAMISNRIFQYKDGSELANLEHAYIKELSKEVVEIA